MQSRFLFLTGSPLTSLPIREEMMTKYSNLSVESHNISLTGKCVAFQIIQCPQKFLFLSKPLHLPHKLLILAHGLVGETRQYLIELEHSMWESTAMRAVCSVCWEGVAGQTWEA